MIRKFLFLLATGLVCSYQAQAQSLVKDFFKSQDTKTQKSTTKGNTGDRQATPQDVIPYINPAGNTSTKSSNSFNFDLISDGLYIVKQQYILRTDDGEEKTRDGMSYYGESYGLAVLSSEGYLVTNKVAEPWKYDKDSSTLSDEEPELSNSYISSINNVNFVLQEEYASYSETDFNNVYSFTSDIDDKGFTLMSEKNIGAGTIIWVTSDETFTSFELSADSYEANLKTPDAVAVEAPKDVVGGIFIIPVRTNVGQLTYRLAGIIDTDGEKVTLNPIIIDSED